VWGSVGITSYIPNFAVSMIYVWLTNPSTKYKACDKKIISMPIKIVFSQQTFWPFVEDCYIM